MSERRTRFGSRKTPLALVQNELVDGERDGREEEQHRDDRDGRSSPLLRRGRRRLGHGGFFFELCGLGRGPLRERALFALRGDRRLLRLFRGCLFLLRRFALRLFFRLTRGLRGALLFLGALGLLGLAL